MRFYMRIYRPVLPLLRGFNVGGGLDRREGLKHMDDDAYSQLAVAYVRGFKVTDEDLASSSHIRPAESADDIGVTICSTLLCSRPPLGL